MKELKSPDQQPSLLYVGARGSEWAGGLQGEWGVAIGPRGALEGAGVSKDRLFHAQASHRRKSAMRNEKENCVYVEDGTIVFRI